MCTELFALFSLTYTACAECGEPRPVMNIVMVNPVSSLIWDIDRNHHPITSIQSKHKKLVLQKLDQTQ